MRRYARDAMWAAELATLESVRAANLALGDLEEAQAECRCAEEDLQEEEDAALEAQIWRRLSGEAHAEEAPWAEEEMHRSSGSVGGRSARIRGNRSIQALAALEVSEASAGRNCEPRQSVRSASAADARTACGRSVSFADE